MLELLQAPLAQLDRVPVFGTGGSGSNPARGIHTITLRAANLTITFFPYI